MTGKQLERIRTKILGMTQAELAEQIPGIKSWQTISGWERDQNKKGIPPLAVSVVIALANEAKNRSTILSQKKQGRSNK